MSIEKFEPLKQFGNHNPNTELLDKLRKHLINLTHEEFLKECAEINEMVLEGPTIEEFLNTEIQVYNSVYNKAIEDVLKIIGKKDPKYDWSTFSKIFGNVIKKVKDLKK